jgi:hypothetical protein
MCSPMERQVPARDRRRSSVGPARGRWCVVVGGACSLSRQVIGRTRRGAEHRVALAARACAVRRPARPHLTRRSPPMCAACPRVRHAHRHRHCRDRGAEHRCTAPRGEQAMARACSATVEYITPVYLNLIGDHDWHGLASGPIHSRHAWAPVPVRPRSVSQLQLGQQTVVLTNGRSMGSCCSCAQFDHSVNLQAVRSLWRTLYAAIANKYDAFMATETKTSIEML